MLKYSKVILAHGMVEYSWEQLYSLSIIGADAVAKMIRVHFCFAIMKKEVILILPFSPSNISTALLLSLDACSKETLTLSGGIQGNMSCR